MLRSVRFLAPLALAAGVALSAGACNKDKGNTAALAQDTTLNRDLQLANKDSAAQPQLKDVPAPDSTAATPAAPAPVASAPSSKPVEHTRPHHRAPSSSPSTSASAPAPDSTTTASGNSVAVTPSGSSAALGTIAAGTTLNLTSNDKICTNTNKAGDKFTASVADAVVGTNGATIPAGSNVAMQVADLERSSNATKAIQMTFSVQSVSIGGTSYPLSAQIDHVDVTKQRNASVGSDAAKVAGGAVIGAIIGQVIGHNTKGTVIGAATGAAAGTAVAMGTAAYEGCVPQGGKITIHLTDPAQVAAR
ncbi:MAG TPA: glycine zipper 2TM domain-containing protein [Gemmatimonadaceae bacterium]|nr:glycine zipper 2TM domain-containing protein [Gemmatimonadaceae bacterium]